MRLIDADALEKTGIPCNRAFALPDGEDMPHDGTDEITEGR